MSEASSSCWETVGSGTAFYTVPVALELPPQGPVGQVSATLGRRQQVGSA
jgi:hypothetical protein